MKLIRFFIDCAKVSLSGNTAYWAWVSVLLFFISMGGFTYLEQMRVGLVITGMSDQVSWGFYVSNFTFLVGVAAAAVMLVIPAYIFHNPDAKRVVLLGEGLAVAASLMCMLFVSVDLGRPDRIWHLSPWPGMFNWPSSLLTWDVIVLSGYLGLNLAIPGYILYNRYQGTEYNKKLVFGAAVLSMFWAISIHTVTAFLFASNSARPFWASALVAPRFLATAFCAGPAFIILAFSVMHKVQAFQIGHKVIDLLSVIVAVSMQINLIMLAAELFVEFYAEGQHSASARYLFLGLDGKSALVPWIWSAQALNVGALILLMIEKTRKNYYFLALACVMAVIGIWIEKGMGFVIPGFIPTPLGEVFEYMPTWMEVKVALGVYGIGALVFTLMMKPLRAIQLGLLANPNLDLVAAKQLYEQREREALEQRIRGYETKIDP
ncbi:MAG: polysulfide reductase [Candidatus Lambdaproteobacteria bacterium RIFOXYD2_FULL_50_16]|uniref:Polysulfide reductase n=1 Tax=Candidatus Lambdaproteobacteria bacterium RIFOXYD2_FULL_50_16 TaxID=1817772 RepID=A0A1F6G7M5_9PROT|nr:MAG: polysulfide reductase [Candidatus Lambdaproteobacteria bacterium RIFOXYD2_FULL_50_16]